MTNKSLRKLLKVNAPSPNQDLPSDKYEIQEYKDGFTYRLVNLGGMFGWELRLADDTRTEFTCTSKYNNFPVISLYKTFSEYKHDHIDLSKMDTSNVITALYTFEKASKLKDLDISMLNTSKLVNIRSIFDHCTSLEHVNFGNIDTSNLVNISYMFYGCSSLKDIDLSKQNLGHVGYAYRGITNCSELRSVKLPYSKEYSSKYLSGIVYQFKNIQYVVTASEFVVDKLEKEYDFQVIKTNSPDNIEKILSKIRLINIKNICIYIVED